MSSSTSSSGEDGDMTEDSCSESDEELEGGVKSLSTCSSSVEATSLNPESCGEGLGSAYLELFRGAFFDTPGVRGADGAAFFREGVRTLDGVAEALVAVRLGLLFISFCSCRANSSSPSK